MDVIEGRGPSPSLVLILVRGLPDDSMTVALASGGKEHFGWGQDRHLLADLFDAINANTRATGNWKKGHEPKLEPYPRPKPKAKPARDPAAKPLSVAEIYKRLQRR